MPKESVVGHGHGYGKHNEGASVGSVACVGE